ncbi:SusD-like starch-binding protein associating with outer membrane [Aquimarina sp. MAR_2010_214]|uniref:RagB/SusD family nutrient uptake outer membrane protein n=1 Tax=Aquimarina sp. MAR_2010_214 TaxID=1250026 RepID=UPI000C700606|nr:RagB/SusD family nutrient uptake outer membrane protein [Aquimarina sp. MAR_2010_214]PKV50466.1 SusD-like starch-binding protein associating with outer membrane [Aquimarina sp. MAR_2010_214]
MKTNIKLIGISLLTFLMFSCEDSLDELPDNRTQIDTAEKIGEVLTLAYPLANYSPFLAPMTDNADDKGPSARENRVNTEMYFWRDVNDNDSDFPTHYWNECYKAISQANHALQAIEDLGGGSELNYLKGEALIARAYAHFMLVNIWSKTYNPSTAGSDLGIPYVLEPENVVIKEYKRGTVKEVYEKIEADIVAGLPLITNKYTVPKFHFNKNAANAFASRFYLFKGDWEKVIQYSNQVLGTAPADLLRDWTGKYRSFTYSQVRNEYSSTAEVANLLIVSGASLYGRGGNFLAARYQLSTDLANTLFFNGSQINNKRWSYKVYGSDLFLNTPKHIEYFRTTNAAAGIGFAFTNSVLLTTDEVLLNRAEAFTMLGQTGNAVSDINAFLSKKIRDYDAATDVRTLDQLNTLHAVDQGIYEPFYTIEPEKLALLNGIIEYRRREFQNEGLRWFDIRRFNLEIVHEDFFDNKSTLTKTDNRKQLQIPVDGQSFGLQSNPR